MTPLGRGGLAVAWFFVALGAARASPSELGLPFFAVHGPEAWQGGAMVYVAARDSRGVVYFGTDEAVVEYDGVSWRRIGIPNPSAVRSLADVGNRDRGWLECIVVGRAADPAPSPHHPESGHKEVLLLNAPDNSHTLGIRILSLWLADHGRTAQVLMPPFAPEELDAVVRRTRPLVVMISISLAEQRPGVEAIIGQLAALDGSEHRRILIGGSAVKLNMVPSIKGAELAPDLPSLGNSLWD